MGNLLVLLYFVQSNCLKHCCLPWVCLYNPHMKLSWRRGTTWAFKNKPNKSSIFKLFFFKLLCIICLNRPVDRADSCCFSVMESSLRMPGGVTMCRNSSSGFPILTKLGMEIPEKQRGTLDRMEGVGSVMASWVGMQGWGEDMLFEARHTI